MFVCEQLTFNQEKYLVESLSFLYGTLLAEGLNDQAKGVLNSLEVLGLKLNTSIVEEAHDSVMFL